MVLCLMGTQQPAKGFLKLEIKMDAQKIRYKMLFLAVIAAARTFIKGELANAIFDMIEEDVLTNFDSIFDKATKRKPLIAAIKSAAKGIKDDPFAKLLQCLEECEIEEKK